MKVKLYKMPGKETIDSYSLYFPYPKWLREHDKCRGFFINCSQDSNGGVIRCAGDYDEWNCFLGKRFPLEKMSEQFQNWAHHLEKLFNDALKYNDAEHWETWCRA